MYTTQMNTTANQITDWAICEIGNILDSGKFRNAKEVYKYLAEKSQVSAANIRFIHQRTNTNPGVDTLDKLVTAIKGTHK